MKKAPKKVMAAAVMFAAALNMNGCGVYGPPSEEDTVFSAEINAEQNVYGPPPDLGKAEESAETCETADTAEAELFDPAININPEVYGPPEWFE